MTERRRKLEILQSIKHFFDDLGYQRPFYKSDLKNQGIDPATAEDFLKIIMFCQRELPFIEVTDFGKRFMLKENISQKHLDMNEFLQLKEELNDKRGHLTPVDLESKMKLSKEEWTMTYNSDPILAMKFDCQECDFSIQYPTHCGEQLDFNATTNQLECSICKIVQPVPIHHTKEMKIVITNQKDNKNLFKFVSSLRDKE